MNTEANKEEGDEREHQRVKKLAKQAIELLSKMIKDEEKRIDTLFTKIYADKNPTRGDVKNNFRLLRTHVVGAMCIQEVIACEHVATKLCSHFRQFKPMNGIVNREHTRTMKALSKKRKEFVKEDKELRVIAKESELYLGVGTFQLKRKEKRTPLE